MAPRWECGRRLLSTATRPVAEWLIERLAPEPGQTILEVAAGTGETGFLAAERLGPEGVLISSDAEPGMVEAARRGAEELGLGNMQFRVLDAAALELPDTSVDGAISQFGYILRGDPPRSLTELRRVLRPGGRLVFSVWAERERNPWMTVPTDAMRELGLHGGPTDEQRKLSSRRNPEAIRRLLEEAGFALVELEELAVSYGFSDSDELWLFVSELRGPLALARLDDEQRKRVREAIEARVVGDSGELSLGGVSLNVLAT